MHALHHIPAQNVALHSTKSIYECQEDNLSMFALSRYNNLLLLLQDSWDEQFEWVC